MHFDSDYMNICHPLILKRMAETQHLSFPGYGADEICSKAKATIRTLCQCPEADIFFLCGGTQTNMVVINSLLRSYEGVLSADIGHIAIHEAGAIELTGHKVLPLPSHNGKITAKQVDDYIKSYYSDPNWQHIVTPGMLYITHPTEYGTIYTLEELETLSGICKKHNIPLYLDGARMGYALCADGADVSLTDIARLCDAFYIGGTKCGAMYGEAVVFPDKKRSERFFTQVKQHGALLAKGWIAGLQFDCLLSHANDGISQAKHLQDTLYYNICRHAITQATRLKKALIEKGYSLYIDSPTNQLFIEIPLSKAQQLKQHITYGEWDAPRHKKIIIRLATSWATKISDIDELIKLL